MAPIVPHFSLPFRFVTQEDGTKSAEAVEQDSYNDLRCCVEAIIRYEKGSRSELPEFGIIPLEFSSNLIDTDPLLSDLQEWEPRAEIEIPDAEIAVQAPFGQDMRIKVDLTSCSGQTLLAEQ